jgi:hypothetical protein
VSVQHDTITGARKYKRDGRADAPARTRDECRAWNVSCGIVSHAEQSLRL